ncbi:hypothetical protein Nepgr_020990 [Nepenthes gracilis]|uniref:Uncharacterized protein n=1 Tax=Nepenthes gracilis TaxID=150966 RepID=A0AAD3SXY1_NEPGR|nr:hypothetical protein Nepgr_020990 [Nepenthes gracilis]
MEDGNVRSRREISRDERKEGVAKSKGKGDRMVEIDVKPQKPSALTEANPASDKAILGRTGGVYILPFKLARMMKEVEDKSSVENQRLT